MQFWHYQPAIHFPKWLISVISTASYAFLTKKRILHLASNAKRMNFRIYLPKQSVRPIGKKGTALWWSLFHC
jgi:hypothetical protein